MDGLVSGASMIRWSLHPFAGFRDIGLQQDPRLQYLACRALSFPNQRFKPFAFLAAQPHNILLYRNLLRSHDCLPRQSLATKANHEILSNWLKRATRPLTMNSNGSAGWQGNGARSHLVLSRFLAER